jgi:hypothetical protein
MINGRDYSIIRFLEDVRRGNKWDAEALMINNLCSLSGSGSQKLSRRKELVVKYRDDKLGLQRRHFNSLNYALYDSIARPYLDSNPVLIGIFEGRKS